MRLLELSQKIDELTSKISGTAREFDKISTFTVESKHYSESTAYSAYLPKSTPALCVMLDKLKSEFNSLINNELKLTENYNLCLNALKASNFSRATKPSYTHKHKIVQDGVEQYMCTDEYNLTLELSMCLKYLNKLGVQQKSVDIVRTKEVFHLLLPQGNNFIALYISNLGVVNFIQDGVRYLDLVDVTRTLFGSNELIGDIVAKSLRVFKEQYSDKPIPVDKFILETLKAKYEVLNRIIRRESLPIAERVVSEEDLLEELRILKLKLASSC
jgi:hypothetical protein